MKYLAAFLILATVALAQSVESPEYVLDQKLGLKSPGANEFLNWGGKQEKWMLNASNAWFYITPDGAVWQWRGGALANDLKVGQVSIAAYADTRLLWDAKPPVVVPDPVDPDACHCSDPVRKAEHEAMMALVPRAEATHTAINDGLASNPDTWDGTLPDATSSVVIPAGCTVTLDKLECKWLRVSGTLQRATDRDTSLRLDTLVTDVGSVYEDLTPAEFKSLTIIRDDGPIDTVRDPLMLSRGALFHGKVNIRGPPVAPDRERAKAWKPGDVVTLDRNIVFRSDATDIQRRGHVMFMHTPLVHVEGVLFDNLGRTDKSRKVTDAIAGRPDTLTNVRGRYPVHLHRSDANKNQAPAIIRHCAVTRSPGWGIVNHDSHALIENNETFDIFGAGIVTELGTEVGTIKGNVCIYSKGQPSPFAINDGREVGLRDMGHRGHGIWAWGGGVEVSDNICTGSGHSDIVFMGSESLAFTAANLPDPSIWTGAATMPGDDVPIRCFRNETYSPIGLIIWAMHTNHYHKQDSRVEDCTFNRGVVSLGYSGYIHFKNCKSVGDINKPLFGSAYNNTGASISGMTYENLTIEGWQIGLSNPCTEDNSFDFKPSRIIGGTFNNIVSIYILNTQQGWRRTLLIDGTQKYGTLSATAMAGNKWPYWWATAPVQQQWDIYMALHVFNWNMQALEGWPYTTPMPEAQWRMLFASPNRVASFQDEIKLGDEYLSFAEFGPTYNLGVLKNLPADLRLKADGTARTAAELAADKGLKMGARTLPGDARQAPRVRGWLHKAPANFVTQ